MHNWKFSNVVFGLVKAHMSIRLFSLLAVYMVITSFLIPYTNINFTTKVTIDLKFALKCLILNVILELIGAYLNLIVTKNKKDFVLSIQEQFIKLVCGRIYGMNWTKIRDLNKNELPDKISRAIFAVENCINMSISYLMDTFVLFGSIVILMNISPLSLLIIIVFNLLTYFYIIKRENIRLLAQRNLMHQKNEKFWDRYWTTLRNSNEYIIHHQKDKIVDVIKQSRYDLEKTWMDLEYENDRLIFKSNIINQTTVLICILLYVHNTIFNIMELFSNNPIDPSFLNKETILIVLTLYIYLSRLSEKFDDLLKTYTFFTKWEKDYERIKIVLDESDERLETTQLNYNNHLEFCNIDFTYEQTDNRKAMRVYSNGTFRFHKGETVLVKGASGAGKSTLYDIINGSIPQSQLAHCSVFVDGKQCPDGFHNLEYCRTMVLQDSAVSYDHSCHEIITDISDDDIISGAVVIDMTNSYRKVPDDFVWHLLDIVKLSDFFREQFGGDLHMRLKDKISGGQKTRLLLARALFRASEYGRNSSILILDEPDKGLPADMTIEIIQNIIHWFQNKGILFLTLHTKEAQAMKFNHTVMVADGLIQLIH